MTAKELSSLSSQQERIDMYKNGDVCPICETGHLSDKEILAQFEYKGTTLDIPNYLVWECSECKERFVDRKTSKASGRLIRDFYRQVDGLLVASEIRRIRKFRLELSQDAASDLLGGGAKSFARYENSEVIQSVALDNLLRVLDAAPHMLKVIEDKNKPRHEIVHTATATYETSSLGKMVANYGK